MTAARTQLDRLAVGMLVVFCLIWGIQQVSIKIAGAGVSPLLQAGLRSVGATLLVLGWVVLRRVPIWRADGTAAAGILAGLLFAGEFALLYWGLNFTTASRGVIFLYTAPFFVALGAVWLLPQERMRSAQWLGMGLAFGGILVLFGENLFKSSAQSWIGDLMLFGAAVLWAATTLTIKASRLATVAPEKTLLYQLAISAFILPPLSPALGEAGIGTVTPAVAAALLFQTVMVATISYLGWFWLIRHYPATRLSAFSFLTPVFGVIAGGWLLGEPLTLPVFVALGLVALGIWVANRPT